MDFPVGALDGVILSGAREFSVPHVVTVLTAQLLPSERGSKGQVTVYWKAASTIPFELASGMPQNIMDAGERCCRILAKTFFRGLGHTLFGM